MKKILFTTLSLLVACALWAQEPINDQNAVVRTGIKGFHAIKVSVGIEVFLTPGTSEAVAVSAPTDEFRSKIVTVVENGVLEIYFDPQTWKWWKLGGNKKLRAYVSYVNMDDIDISSGASVKIEGTVKTKELKIAASSGAIFLGRVETGSLVVDQSSGAIANIKGTAGKLSVDGSSGSLFRGYELVAENSAAAVSSGACAQLTVSKELAAKASSGGQISYIGGETIIRNVKTSSGGRVSRKS